MSLVLQATGLGKRYGRRWALTDCSLDIPAGHVVGLVGPNGAGKSTLLQLAVGLLKPSAGSIAVLGERPREQLRAATSLWVRVPRRAYPTPVSQSATICSSARARTTLSIAWEPSDESNPSDWTCVSAPEAFPVVSGRNWR